MTFTLTEVAAIVEAFSSGDGRLLEYLIAGDDETARALVDVTGHPSPRTLYDQCRAVAEAIAEPAKLAPL
jgi:hypothetical protein